MGRSFGVEGRITSGSSFTAGPIPIGESTCGARSWSLITGKLSEHGRD